MSPLPLPRLDEGLHHAFDSRTFAGDEGLVGLEYSPVWLVAHQRRNVVLIPDPGTELESDVAPFVLQTSEHGVQQKLVEKYHIAWFGFKSVAGN